MWIILCCSQFSSSEFLGLNSIWLCGVRFVFVNQVFNHMGYISTVKGDSGYCGCDIPLNETSILNDCNGNYYFCKPHFFNIMLLMFRISAYSFVTGFIFYNYDTTSPTGYEESLTAYMEFNLKYEDRHAVLNRDAFDACKASAIRGYEADQATRQAMYNFCTGNTYLYFRMSLQFDEWEEISFVILKMEFPMVVRF